jgi:transcriptional regulator with XRE-family HTH domain
VTLGERFGRNLWRVRRRESLSQEELAGLAGLHRTEISLLETGGRIARVDTFMKIAGALEVDPAELLRGIEWVPAAPSRDGQFYLDEG